MNVLIKSGWLGRNTITWYLGADNLGLHVIALVNKLRELGCRVHFAGENKHKFIPDVEIHIEKQWPSSLRSKKILIKSEPAFIQPQNLVPSDSIYDIIFDWRTDVPTSGKYRHYLYPRNLELCNRGKWSDRKLLVSCIAANKNSVFNSRESLYGVRQKLISQFDAHLGLRFSLYGGGWAQSDHPVGMVAKIIYKKFSGYGFLNRDKSYVSYRGICESKFSVMQNSKFSLCIENTAAPGGISEKLIDCLSARVVPIYLGATDIKDIVPPSLYIDLRSFQSQSDLFDFLENANSSYYEEWQDQLEAVAEGIRKTFSVDSFVERMAAVVLELINVS